MTSFLLNDALLLDGGSAASALTIEEQAALAGVVISHAHLDHVGDIPYVADNVFGLRTEPLRVLAAREVIEEMRRSIFNNVVWPDFSEIHHEGKPIIEFVALERGKTIACGGVRITPYAVNHQPTTFGFVLEDAEGALLYTSDTGPTEDIWRGGMETEKLHAIVTEVSFPNRMEELARVSHHLTPALLRAEMRKMPPAVPVYIYHLKIQHHEETRQEIEDLNEPRIHLLEDGETYGR